MNYCNGDKDTASTFCNPCPYEGNCENCEAGRSVSGMPDREKIINALECFSKNRICLPHLIPWDEIVDAIALLKEQEEETEWCERCGRVRLKSKWEGR